MISINSYFPRIYVVQRLFLAPFSLALSSLPSRSVCPSVIGRSVGGRSVGQSVGRSSIDFQWIANGFSMDFQLIFSGVFNKCSMDFFNDLQWICDDFQWIFNWISNGFLNGFAMIFNRFSMDLQWIFNGFAMIFNGFSIGFSMDFQ